MRTLFLAFLLFMPTVYSAPADFLGTWKPGVTFCTQAGIVSTNSQIGGLVFQEYDEIKDYFVVTATSDPEWSNVYKIAFVIDEEKKTMTLGSSQDVTYKYNISNNSLGIHLPPEVTGCPYGEGVTYLNKVTSNTCYVSMSIPTLSTTAIAGPVAVSCDLSESEARDNVFKELSTWFALNESIVIPIGAMFSIKYKWTEDYEEALDIRKDYEQESSRGFIFSPIDSL